MVNFTYRGLCAAVFNVFNKDLSVNLKIIPEYAQFLAKNNIDGVLVHGTTGEGMSMSVAERKSVLEEWVKAVKTTKQHLMVQVGGCPLADVLDLARHAEKVGVDSILCLTELYFKPKSPKDLVNYLKHVGEAAPNTPLLYYHNPAYSGVNINMEQFLNLVGDVIPNFKGIKYTSNDLDIGLAALRAKNRQFTIFLGANSLIAPAFSMGFDSTIATSLNMMPQYAAGIAKAVKENNIPEAKRIQEELTAATCAITKNGAWVSTMKVAMSLLTPIDVGLARRPIENLTNEQVAEMKQTLKKMNVAEYH